MVLINRLFIILSVYGVIRKNQQGCVLDMSSAEKDPGRCLTGTIELYRIKDEDKDIINFAILVCVI